MRSAQRGAAVLMAMLVVAVSAVLVSSAFLRQSVLMQQVENEIAIDQAQRLLDGAIDWVRVILLEDARTSATDHLGEPWAVTLEETRLDNDSGEPAWVSGAIEDAQSRFNLRNLSGPGGPALQEVDVLRRLLELVGSEPALAESIALQIHAAVAGRPGAAWQDRIMPATLDDIAWRDSAEREAIELLRPFITLIPVPTPVNANTAPAEVLAARFESLSLVDARRLVESRERTVFRDLQDMGGRLRGQQFAAEAEQVAVATQYFLVRGFAEYRRVRVQALALLWRHDGQVEVLWSREEAA
jgi:general secretion pathway protein K